MCRRIPRGARWQAFLQRTDRGYRLRRDLHYRDNLKPTLETGPSSPVPAFLWPIADELKIPALMIRATESDMFEAATLKKARSLNPRLVAIELHGSHDLAGDNPQGLADAVSRFLVEVGL